MMTTRWMRSFGLAIVMGAFALGPAGCGDFNLDDVLEEIELEINQNINQLQTVDPQTVILPPSVGSTVVVSNEALIIDDISQDLVYEEIPNVTVLGLENFTGFDAFYVFAVDGVEQRVFVFDGETLLIEYPCLSDIELISEDYFDIFTGEFVTGFDIGGAIFSVNLDFACGDAFIITFDADGIVAAAEAIDLLN